MWLESDSDWKPVPGEWIVAKLDELKASLRVEDRRFRELEPGRFTDPALLYSAVARGAFDEAVAIVCDKYGIDSSRVHIEWVPDIADARVAAHVKSEPLGRIDVTVRAHYKTNPRGFGTIMAHELGHAYLTDMGIDNGGSWEAEATTDLVTFVKGLGKLTVNGVDQIGPGQRAGSRCYGYLNREAMVFAYARTALLYGLGREESRAGLNTAVLGYLNVLSDEPGLLGRLLAWLAARLRRRKKITEQDIAIDEHGNIVDRSTGRKL